VTEARGARFAQVAVVGAGAVGSFFGAMLARAGHRVTLIGRAAHMQAVARHGLRLQTATGVQTVHPATSTDIAAVGAADLVLVCVKSTDTAATARQLAPLLRADAVVLSLQNGVENAGLLAKTLAQTIVPAVVYVATALPEPGTVLHLGRGDLVVGAADPGAKPDAALAATLHEVADFFAAAGVPVRVSADVVAELWSKLVVNCACNAISALAQLPYGALVGVPEVAELQQAVVREVVAVAAASGVHLDLQASLDAVQRIQTGMPAQHSSTAQDLARRKPSEIDHLNGFVARRGRERGVATPANQALHALVKLVESGWPAG
jgi:2-dehydropantoate 2-reductase